MRHLILAVVVSFSAFVVNADAHAAKKAKAAKAKKGGKDDGLSAGIECVLSKPLAVKIMTGKKGKPAKLSKDSRVRISEVGAMVKLTTPSGEATVKRALLAKVCVKSEGESPAPSDAALDAASTVKPDGSSEGQAAAPAPSEPAPAESSPQPPPSEPVAQPDAAPALTDNNPPPQEASATMDPDRAEKLSRARAMRGLAITFTILGVGGLGAGGAFLALALINDAAVARQIDEYNAKPVRTQEEFNQITARTTQVVLFRNIAIISGAAGLALLTTGIILFAVGENPNKYAGPALKVVPTFALTPDGAAFGLVGRF